MTLMGTIIITLLGTTLTTLLGLVGYYFKKRDNKLEETREHLKNLELRINTIETTFSVLGDINNTLTTLRGDVQEVKARLNILRA